MQLDPKQLKLSEADRHVQIYGIPCGANFKRKSLIPCSNFHVQIYGIPCGANFKRKSLIRVLVQALQEHNIEFDKILLLDAAPDYVQVSTR